MTAPKRPREASSTDGASPEDASSKIESPTASASGSQQASSFRNVSACNRCRLRKNRCDQRLPACASCEKAHVKCVGYDPITKREIPRSYVYYLESRVAYLQSLLRDNQIPFAPPEHFALSYKPPNGEATFPLDKQARAAQQEGQLSAQHDSTADDGADTKQQEQYDRDKINKMVSNIGMVSVQGASDPRFLGSTSGISFARVVFAAVKSSVSGASSEKGSVRASKPLPGQAAANGTSMRDSFFGLHTKPTIRQAPFPERDLALRLVELYFEHANPQIPILHRGEFMAMFERALATDPKDRTSRELYMLNIVFAIGAGIIMGSSDATSESPDPDATSASQRPLQTPPPGKRRRLASVQHQPEEYHASAIVHLESFLSSSPSVDRPDGFGGGLEELQAVLLLAGFALLRPVAPGLWYITGVAVRLGVDLGLHYEDGAGIDGGPSADDTSLLNPGHAPDDAPGANNAVRLDPKERGRRQWVRDLRRRLWWCVYSFDRLVSTCVGRPFGITDQVITTEFPSPLDDRYITREGFLQPPGGSEKPTYKCVSYHYFRLRLLQSEILQVLQHRQTQQARAIGANQGNDFMHTNLPSPFLSKFDSFLSWRRDIDRRLWEWKESSPTQMDTGVQFSPLFLELNYWQAVIMLYRQSLSVPPVLADELKSTEDDVSSPSMVNLEEREDEEHVFLKVAEAGQKVLKLYRQLHRVHLVNYTFLATHHLFMAGISFLYAIWHSPVVRSHLSLDDVDFTVLAATSVLGDLIEKCPPAEACRDAFDRMSKATIQMCMSTTGFGPQALAQNRAKQQQTYHSSPNFSAAEQQPTASPTTEHPRGVNRPSYFPSSNANSNYNSRKQHPRFDMNLRDLFSDDESESRLRRPSLGLVGMRPSNSMQNQVKQETPRPATSSATFVSPEMRQFSSAQVDSQLQTSAATSPVQMQQRPAHQRHHSHQQQMRQQQPQISPYTQQQTSPYTPTYGPNVAMAQQQTAPGYPDIGQSTFPDLDFLDAFPAGSASAEAGGGGNMDLGFGMQLDDISGANNHDWSDGNAFDLFDGFFFGQGPGAPGSL
ncbi:hypothetical protein BFW01_g1159 [Lasiodiplodia theobromae]|uniref:Zn(2)-C6 fungal-type domain-containing protein n=1 Tax=Lasiodiplodia theobromae TaxID=45133 RepID=A0A8H7IRR6_9PEZI|nr:hypothetical protein BFW01_g1159 [Lasiodiplodia theobromae]